MYMCIFDKNKNPIPEVTRRSDAVPRVSPHCIIRGMVVATYEITTELQSTEKESFGAQNSVAKTVQIARNGVNPISRGHNFYSKCNRARITRVIPRRCNAYVHELLGSLFHAIHLSPPRLSPFIPRAALVHLQPRRAYM